MKATKDQTDSIFVRIDNKQLKIITTNMNGGINSFVVFFIGTDNIFLAINLKEEFAEFKAN
jgi:hypothetical protein